MGRVEARIDLDALRHNLQIARNNCPDSRLAGVVKANAYGHGLAPVARALDKSDLLAVTDVHEGLQLNELSVPQPILLLQGIIEPEDIDLIALHNMQCVVHSLAQLDMLEERLRRRPPPQALSIWLKMDSGMGRLGIAPGDYVDAYKRLARQPWCRDIVMMSHLASSSEPGASLNDKQRKQFEQVKKKLKRQFPGLVTSLAASGGILGSVGTQENWARPGIMLYGSSPFPWSMTRYRAEQLGLLPVMTLQSRLITVKTLRKGDNVGYNSQFVCPHDMRVGVASIGYADGYPSNAPNFTPVLVNGERSRTLGRVSMDMLAVDLSALPDARPGDPVTLWGQGLSVDEVAEHTGILSYNLFCSVTRRVNFIYG